MRNEKKPSELVFGQIKDVRGFRRFLLRGLDSVKAEWQLICLTHNLLKLYRWGLAQSNGMRERRRKRSAEHAVVPSGSSHLQQQGIDDRT